MSKGFKEQIYDSYFDVQVDQHGSGTRASLEEYRATFYVKQAYYGRFLPASKHAKILDLGCGDGGLVFWLRERGYAFAEGVDVSAQMIEHGRACGIEGLHVGGVAEFLEEKDGVYDLITGMDIFEHLDRQEVFDTLAKVKKALKPGGRLVIQVPNGQGIFHTRIFYGDFTHEMAYTIQSLRQIFKSNGLVPVGFYPVRPIARGLSGIVRTILWRGLEGVVRFFQMVETGSKEGIYTSNIIGASEKPSEGDGQRK